MSRRAFDTELALDLAVNFIPFVIIVFFIGLFAVFNPWGFDPLRSTIQFAILISIAVSLAVVTAIAARVIESDDHTRGETP
ncbi:DUF6684 family protein [Natrialba taiwanensis]|uniref:Cox cluster protein n=1 Tax=Natrialba taiwanensis DSM 12281 TaxID=1230458 RepID=L9ZIA7_9EURY|nr:DUF6684 family protein [Natrialba taiwanensis]ELY85327.1 hypothetical protein C484_20842 [Natrialba taiwanensis DSM 12281]